MSRSFVREKFAWLRQVARDDALPSGAARVAVELCGYFNASSREAWPATGTLATALALSEDTVRRALQAMARRGHLVVEVNRGRNATNRFRPSLKFEPLKPPQNCENLGEENPSELQGFEEGENPANLQGLKSENLANLRLKPRKSAAKTSQNCEGNPFKNPMMNPLKESQSKTAASEEAKKVATKKPSRPSKKRSLRDDEIKAEFQSWWQQYPRHVAKDAAERAYAAARVRGATAQELLHGAMRYAAERDRELDPGKRATFTAHPATWLNAKRWADDPTPAPQPAAASQANGSRPPDRRLSPSEIALQVIRDRHAAEPTDGGDSELL